MLVKLPDMCMNILSASSLHPDPSLASPQLHSPYSSPLWTQNATLALGATWQRGGLRIAVTDMTPTAATLAVCRPVEPGDKCAGELGKCCPCFYPPCIFVKSAGGLSS